MYQVNEDYTTLFITTIITTIILVTCIAYRPILLLYAPSSLLSMNIRTPEFLNRSLYFPNHSKFEEPLSFQKIKKEVDDMLQKTNNGNTLTLTKESYGGENTYIGSDVKTVNGVQRGWRLLNIKAGSYTKDAIVHFPYLVSILETIPEITSCVVSVLEPGIHIPIHVGYYKGIMRYMIATHVPTDRNNVFLCVNGIKYHWKEGRGVLWDDTFPHKVYNNSDEPRVVIYMDVIRPIQYGSLLNEWFIRKAIHSSIVQEEIKRTEQQLPIL
jgi:hypothetical protein